MKTLSTFSKCKTYKVFKIIISVFEKLDRGKIFVFIRKTVDKY